MPLRVNVNLKAVTVEDLVARRKVRAPSLPRRRRRADARRGAAGAAGASARADQEPQVRRAGSTAVKNDDGDEEGRK